MSAGVDVAILTALRANTNLVALLGTQDSGLPAIFNAHKLETPPIYDQVTFRESVRDPKNFFAPTWNEDDEYYDLEAWTNKRGSGIIANILREVDRSINKRILAMPDPSTQKMRYIRRIPGGSPTLPDTTLQVWFGMCRYRASVQSV